ARARARRSRSRGAKGPGGAPPAARRRAPSAPRGAPPRCRARARGERRASNPRGLAVPFVGNQRAGLETCQPRGGKSRWTEPSDDRRGILMIDLAHRNLSEEKSRALLRKLRDLNLSAGPIALSSNARVALAGCVSTDDPAESGVRYKIRLADGRDGCLEIRADREGFDVRVYGAEAVERRLAMSVTCDRQGRACARAVGARVSP